MAVEFTPFRVEHLRVLVPQARQRDDWEWLLAQPPSTQAVFEQGVALTGWVGSRCVGMAGMVPVTRYRASAWAFLAKGSGPHMLAVARKVRRVIAAGPYNRVELTVSEHFDAGHRFARLIGADRETPEAMRYFGAEGGSEVMYAVIKD